MHEMTEVYNQASGEKQPHPVPRAWLDHPVLGKGLSETPSAKAATPTSEPVTPAADATELPADQAPASKPK